MRNLFFLLLILPLTSCGKSELNWLILSPNNIEGLTNLKFLLSGLTTTIFISVVSIIISISMVLTMIIAGLFGILVPFTLKKMNIDPAIASSVFVTTITDVIGFVSFLGVGAYFL